MPYKDPAKQKAYWARPEMRHYQRDRRRERRAEFFADKACCDCGATDDLHLDHRDPSQKVGHDVWLWSADARAVEIAKCDVRCAPCHYERHAKLVRRHGISRYMAGCRCEVCRAAKSSYVRKYRARRRQGGAQDRTGVSSFAGKRVSHSATPPESASLPNELAA